MLSVQRSLDPTASDYKHQSKYSSVRHAYIDTGAHAHTLSELMQGLLR